MRQQFSFRFVTAMTAVGIAIGLGIAAFGGAGWEGGQRVAAQGVPPVPTAGVIQRTISVSGTGIATLPPDLARFSVGVSEQGADVMAPQATVATKTDAIIAALRTAGIDVNRDVRTVNYSIQPIYDNSRNNTQMVTGYRVSNQVNVTVRDISGNRVGTLIDATVKAGANTTSSISFGLANPEAAANQAREDAMRNAKSKADTLARAAGVQVGPVITISETSVAPVQSRELASAMAVTAGAVPAPPTPIQAGETSVTINVSVVYTLQ